jgi:hypothetical protein
MRAKHNAAYAEKPHTAFVKRRLRSSRPSARARHASTAKSTTSARSTTVIVHQKVRDVVRATTSNAIQLISHCGSSRQSLLEEGEDGAAADAVLVG